MRSAELHILPNCRQSLCKTNACSHVPVAVPPPSFIQSTFTSHTGSLLLSLYAPRYCLTASAGFGRQFTKLRALSRLRRRYGSKKESYPRPLRPPPPHEKAPSPSAGGGAIFKQKSSFIQPARRCPGFPGAHCSADRPKPRRSTARCSSHRPGAGRHS